MNLRRGGLSSAFGVSLASLMFSGCLMQVVPVAKDDGGVSDAPVSGDASTPGDAVSPTDSAMPTDAPTPTDSPTPDPMQGAGSVDLLVVVDDSNSMTRGQDYLTNYVGGVVSGLIQRHGVRDVRVGVVSTDLGTPGSVIPSCVGPAGDDGVLNPRERGAATSIRPLPTPVGSCEMISSAPWIDVTATLNPMVAQAIVPCQMALGLGGCGLEQPLEASLRALTTQSAAGGPNAGFLRRDATLAILLLTDEEDASVRDCRHHDGIGECADALDVYNAMSTRWASADLNLRMYNYTPGSTQDPTWALERYVDPLRPTRGFLGLKPGHPERVVFAAIAGVPVATPQRADGTTDWDALLGPAAAGRADDFNARDASRAFTDAMNPTGPVSMRQSDPDPVCSVRNVPACRFVGATAGMSCDSREQPFAWRARRIAEVARRFDESAMCAGASCRNGMVASICGDNDSTPFQRFTELIARRVVR